MPSVVVVMVVVVGIVFVVGAVAALGGKEVLVAAATVQVCLTCPT